MVENAIQGMCADLLTDAMPRVEDAGYPIVMHSHDELASEVPVGFGSVEEHENLMAQSPIWATDMPIAAKGWRGLRYRK